MSFTQVPVPPEIAKEISKLSTALLDLKDCQIKVESVKLRVPGDHRPWTLTQGKRPGATHEKTGSEKPLDSDGVHCFFDGDGEPALCGFDD